LSRYDDMEDIRKAHNTFKKDLIRDATTNGDLILDVGCGCGGDLQKWRHAGANISMCDPDEKSLEEAKSRAKNLKIRVNFYHGDIFNCPNRRYDVVCFQLFFTLHIRVRKTVQGFDTRNQEKNETWWKAHRNYSRF
jgi:ubiquinone/menaquinone biosynthesis C-methylase UbiE